MKAAFLAGNKYKIWKAVIASSGIDKPSSAVVTASIDGDKLFSNDVTFLGMACGDSDGWCIADAKDLVDGKVIHIN